VKTNAEWRDWGRRDPLHGVATWPGRSRSDAQPWTDDEFYAVGALDWEDFSAQWLQYGVDRTSCLEIGCGTGRITRQLAEFFGTVHALDVSDEMIAYARPRVAGDVTFMVTDGSSIPLPDMAVASVFSSLVFQHFEGVSDAEAYLREIHRVLKPGGSMMIQLPLYAWPDAFNGYRLMYRVRRGLSHLRARFRRLRLRFGRARPFFRYLRYEAEWVRSIIPALGFSSVEMRTISLRTHHEWLTFVLARRTNTEGASPVTPKVGSEPDA
jgi:SAM-dependent methyltransferase